MSPRAVLSMLAVVVAGWALLGCGIEGQPFGAEKENEKQEADPVVSKEEISAEEKGSPEFTALDWWRGIQTRNPEAVKAAYAPDVRDQLPEDFDSAIVSFLAPAASTSSIDITSVEERGQGEVILFAKIDSDNAAMDGPLGLPMTKVGDEWFLANDTYLNALLPFFEVQQALGGEPSKGTDPAGG